MDQPVFPSPRDRFGERSETLYEKLFHAFCAHMALDTPQATKDITRSIKRMFRDYFAPPYTVLCGHEKGSEYMADVLVTSFDPKNLIQPGSLAIVPESIGVHLAVESELGGKSASSAYGVMKNVVEDYVKLLVLQAEFRVMIFTSLPYRHEQDHLRNRVDTLRQLYLRTPGAASGVLLIHLQGAQVRSTQVQASTAPHHIRGFVISDDGTAVHELPSPVCQQESS